MPPQNNYPSPPKRRHSFGLILVIIVLVLLLFGAIGFGFWAYAERADFKNNVDEKIAVAVEATKQEVENAKEKEFAERIKNPLRTYNGPAAYGSIQVKYPQTWSGAVSETDSGRTPLDGYFHPKVVPDERSDVGFALHLEVIERPYDQVVDDYESDAENGTVKISPYSPPKVSEVLGVRIDGEIDQDHQGSTVLFPLRDKTISLTTLSPEFVPDFNNIILPNFSFSP